MRFFAVSSSERGCEDRRYFGMGVFLFIGGVTAVAGGSLVALYYLVGSPPQDGGNDAKRRPRKKQLLSQWR